MLLFSDKTEITSHASSSDASDSPNHDYSYPGAQYTRTYQEYHSGINEAESTNEQQHSTSHHQGVTITSNTDQDLDTDSWVSRL